MSKSIVKYLFAALTIAGLAACSKEDEDSLPAASERYISVEVQASLFGSTDSDYNPQPWSSCTTSLYAVPASEVASTQSQLASGVLELASGSTCKPAYTSSTGYIRGAEFGTYTLLVYCTGSATNGYMQGRYTYKQLEYGAANYQYKDKCLFVWGDMSTKGGFYPWQTY